MTTFSSPSLDRGVSKTKDSIRSRRAQLTWFLSFLSLSTHCPHTDHGICLCARSGQREEVHSMLLPGSTSRTPTRPPPLVCQLYPRVLTEGAGMTRVRLLTVEEEEEEDEGGEEYLVQGVGAEVAASDTTYWCSVHRC